jgi:EAL domain-containing protein (putative c-di-GMP-specific phosphodiesterase class I)
MVHRYLKTFPAGTYIFREGEVADCAYLIEKGQVLITVDKDGENVPVSILHEGELFGEMGIIDGFPRSASAFAIDDCEVSVISESLLSERVGSADPIVQLLISLLIKRIRTVNIKFKGGDVVIGEQFATKPMLRQEALKRLKLENDLLQGLARKEFFLVYQGIYDLKTRHLVGFEALARWQNPERGLVPPGEFIDVAEQTSVIIPMGEWILEQGFRDLLILQSELQRPDLKMSINVSARQLDEPTFAGQLKKLQRKIQVNPQNVKLEVTERVLHRGDHILKTIEHVIAQGFSFAMDDFGTGYSSLTSLSNMKVETIKVDRSFVSTMIKDSRSRAIVQAVLAMALELGLEIVAEGIEHEAEAILLSALGCQLGQGYLFAKPKPLEEILRLLSTKKLAA